MAARFLDHNEDPVDDGMIRTCPLCKAVEYWAPRDQKVHTAAECIEALTQRIECLEKQVAACIIAVRGNELSEEQQEELAKIEAGY